MSSLGHKLLSAVLKSEVSDFFKLEITEKELLESEKPLYCFIRDHVQRYGKFPSEEALKKGGFHFSLDISVEEPPKYYADQIKERFIYRNLVSGLNDLHPLLDKESNDFDPYEALNRLSRQVFELSATRYGNQLIDFRTASDPLKKEYLRAFLDIEGGGLQFGWPTLDYMSSGLSGGDMITIVGRPGMGKTMLLLSALRHAWYTQQKSVMLVSMEMIPLPLMQRLAAMHIGRPLTKLRNAELTSKDRDTLFSELELLQEYPVPAWIVNGNLTSTVEDIWNLARQLNPDVIYIDGAYLLKHPNPRLGKYDRVTENAELIKSVLATELDVPVLTTYQFNREAAKKAKKKKWDEIDLEDIGLSDAIGQLSSLVCGVLEEDSIETLVEKTITILKGRQGERGRFRIKWDFDNMDFSEISENIEDLEIK